MSKQKTHKSASKRFKLTKKKELMHRSHSLRHLRSSKSKRQIRSLKRMKKLKGTAEKKIKQLLGVA